MTPGSAPRSARRCARGPPASSTAGRPRGADRPPSCPSPARPAQPGCLRPEPGSAGHPRNGWWRRRRASAPSDPDRARPVAHPRPDQRPRRLNPAHWMRTAITSPEVSSNRRPSATKLRRPQLPGVVGPARQGSHVHARFGRSVSRSLPALLSSHRGRAWPPGPLGRPERARSAAPPLPRQPGGAARATAAALRRSSGRPG
jgi:hypothetical protein